MKDKKTILSHMKKNAKDNGYFLCSDKNLLDDLIIGLEENEKRYGYGSCPCRISSGLKNYDSDIICPCEYRDADVNEFGMCYCGLFVDKETFEKPSKMGPIPERRASEIQDAAFEVKEKGIKKDKIENKTKKLTIWRCTVCGYLCARDMPPPICPICKAKSERFEKFKIN